MTSSRASRRAHSHATNFARVVKIAAMQGPQDMQDMQATGLWTGLCAPCRNYARLYSSTPCAPWGVKVAAHAVYAVAWVFLTTFGAVREALQLQEPGMALACGPPSLRSAQGASFPYSDSCASTRPYNIAYNVINVVGGTLGVAQAAYAVSGAVYRMYMAMAFTNFVFLMQPHFRLAIGMPIFAAAAIVYQQLAYTRMFCAHAGGAFCAHAPRHLWAMSGVYKSVVVVGAVLTAMHAAYVALFTWTFMARRLQVWKRIAESEDALMLTPEMEEAFEAKRIVRRTYDIRHFLRIWSLRSDDDIGADLPRRANRVWRVLAHGSSAAARVSLEIAAAAEQSSPGTSTGSGMDADGDGSITRQEFNAFVEERGVLSTEARDHVWDVLSCGGEHECLTRDSIEDLLCDLFQDRKRLANAILSDHQVFRQLVLYLSITLYPGCAIVIAKIFGYANAFGSGIDLFKTYSVIAAYLYGRVADDVKFLMLMLTRRPFDLGDVLQVDGHTYDVVSFDSSHTVLVGATSNTVTNSVLLEVGTLNLSTYGFSDAFDLTVPLNASFDEANLMSVMQAYMRASPREIAPGSVRTGCVGVDAGGRRLRCHWKYRFRILSRSRLNASRTRVQNALARGCEREVRHAWFVIQMAGGGGLNDAAEMRAHAHDEWKHGKRD